jgi:peptidoglycan/LPS O-acetylase OafA/YrhL
MTSPSGRVSELDSVRGLAAFVVVLHHAWEMILPDQNLFPLSGYPVADAPKLGEVAYWISVTPLRLLFAGHPAVGLFFVLSGFALTKSLQHSRHSGYFPFVVRRFFRIYPPFALVIVVAAGLSWLLHPQAIPGRDWLNHYWRTPVTPNLVFGHLAMIETSGYYNSLDSSMWTLVHELRISLLFPFVAALAFVYPRRVLVGAILGFAVLSVTHLTSAMGALIHPGLPREIFLSWIQTFRYVMFFVFGILVATRFETFDRALTRHPASEKWLWVAAFALLAVPYTKGYIEICYAVGAFILLILCIHSPVARRILRHPTLQWLGKISYSLYLAHLVVLIAAFYSLHDILPTGVILVLYVVVSLLVADVLNRTVELPSSELGKRMAERASQRTIRRQAEVHIKGEAPAAGSAPPLRR